MRITAEQVAHIAALSRLSLTERELETFRDQLSSIIEYVEQLRTLDTTGVEPTSHIVPLSNVMREDVVKSSLPREEALRNAPDGTEDFYRVPKIIE
ncbi:MAG: Asp-tRNA(Asn)/Glu-tRNA(Gln) amidotransferase subunit GatC [Chloroflexota bacterium]|jgi:aspartyl-tRNA(Asn)/glutamyl-tRNA(Gln) amidotransferase subunit C